MTDARATQLAVEQWSDGSASARLTQVAIEQWCSNAVVTTTAVLTQVGVEQWAGLAPPPPSGTFTCGLAQRWDVGQWDQATWDGQIGICPPAGAITVNPGGAVTFVLGHLLNAQTGAITLTGYPVGLLSGRSFPAQTGSIVVSGTATGFSIGYHLVCEAGQIRLNPVAAQVTLTAFLQPEPMSFGTPIMIPNRW